MPYEPQPAMSRGAKPRDGHPWACVAWRASPRRGFTLVLCDGWELGLVGTWFSGRLPFDKEVTMKKKYIVELTEDERSALQEIVKKLKGTSQKVKRANILLKADTGGPGWTDARIAEALDCRTKTVENVRQRFVELGLDEALNGKQRETPPTEKLLDGEQEAKIIALRLGTPPAGYGKWTLRLLARKVVELEIVDSVSYQTVRRTLKKMAWAPSARSNIG
jgi:hypothetical protein